MRIESKDFGELEIEKEKILRFPNGLFAFEEVSEFVLIEKDGYPQKWLQSAKGKDPRFIVFDPDDLVRGYRPVLPKEALSELGLTAGEKPRLLVIAVIPENVRDMTVNLKSPVVVNPKKGLASQVILESENYPVRHRVFKEG